jgi:hypothetical protein
MLNIDSPLSIFPFYINQRDLYIKGFTYSIGVFTFLYLLRSQVAEINLLQLVPGFYLFLLFLSFLLLLFLSDFIVQFPLTVDTEISFGTKILARIGITIKKQLNIVLLLNCVLLALLLVIPLSLDSFNNYGEKTLENLWSFDEVIGLEITLVSIITIVGQIPIGLLSNFTNEKFVSSLPKFWKIFSFSVFVIAGFLTPTIDGYTQLSFAGSTIFFYLLIINLMEKRISIKFPGTTLLGF